MMLLLVKPPKASEGERMPNAASRAQQVMVVTPMGTFCHTNITIIKARTASVMINWDVIEFCLLLFLDDSGCGASYTIGRGASSNGPHKDFALKALFLSILPEVIQQVNLLFRQFSLLFLTNDTKFQIPDF